MPTPATVFDNAIEQWRKEQSYPWYKLKYKLCHANLVKHLPPDRTLRILDVGGGNGIESIPLAEAGHQVDLVDYSQAMLADAQQEVAAKGLHECVRLYQADLRQLATLFAPASFDLLLCHNVIQYVDDIQNWLGEMTALLKPGGVSSWISVNRYARPYVTAFLHNNLEKAVAEIGQQSFSTLLFPATTTFYTAQELADMLTAHSLQIVQDYGIHCMYTYWGDNERKHDPLIHAQLENLEFALTDKFPYKLLATHYQVIAKKIANG